jgi:hypothetical protein
MSKPRKSGLVALAAARASGRPFYLSSAFAGFQRIRPMNDDELAAYLGCHPDELPALSLCRRPDVDSPEFQSDVRSISRRFDLDPLPLLRLLREVAFLDAGQRVGQEQWAGFLMAARDKPDRRRRRPARDKKAEQ